MGDKGFDAEKAGEHIWTFGKEKHNVATLKEDLASDLFLRLDTNSRHSFICVFQDYLARSEIDQSHGYVLSYLFLYAATREDPRLACKSAIARALRLQEKETKKEAKVRALYLREHPDEYEPDDEEVAEGELLDLGWEADHAFWNLDLSDPRRILKTMRSIFALLVPVFAANQAREWSRRLEQYLAGERFLTADKDTQVEIATIFLDYFDEFQINQDHHFALNKLFLDWAGFCDARFDSAAEISRVLKMAENEKKEKDREKKREEMENEFLSCLSAYDLRCVLTAMQTIYAYLTPSTLIKPCALSAQKQAKKAAKPASKGT